VGLVETQRQQQSQDEPDRRHRDRRDEAEHDDALDGLARETSGVPPRTAVAGGWATAVVSGGCWRAHLRAKCPSMLDAARPKIFQLTVTKRYDPRPHPAVRR
jgi:hypothetical protein